MSQEIELKLALDADAAAILEAHPILLDCRRERLTLGNRYYDTPDGELESARVALRIRQNGTRRLQTLKTAATSQGGLSSRGEWEWSLDGRDGNAAGLDVAGLRELDLPALADVDLDRLAPVFSTDFTRDLWHYYDPATKADIEIALDRGTIAVDDRQLTIRELELELKSGQPAALWRLTQALSSGETPLAARPANHSKASRAAALRRGWAAPATLPAPTLDDVIDAVDTWQDSGEPCWQEAAVERLAAIRDARRADRDAANSDFSAALDAIAEPLAAGRVPWQTSAWLALYRSEE